LKLAFDATTLAGRISGVGYYTARLLQSLAGGAGAGLVERVVVLSNREVPLPAGGALEPYTRRRFPVRSVWMQLVLPSVLREVQPDLVHFTNYLSPLVMRFPYVVSFHDMTLSLFPEMHTLRKRVLTSSLIPWVARGARRILTPSEATRVDVIRLLKLDPGRVRVVPYAVAESFRPASEGPARLTTVYGVRPPYFLYVGTIEPRKNLARTLRAFARVAASLPEHQLVLVGDLGWKYEEVLAEARRPELHGRVLLPGYVPEQDLPVLYSHAVAFVYPSLYEGFGFPVVEAMACGAPVLTSRSSSLTEIAEGAAVLVDPLSETGLADALVSLATDASLSQRLRAEGLLRAATFTWERTARETVQVYREVYEETRR
jgi:glycosyltransferase involved in cell wall biosynthesis